VTLQSPAGGVDRSSGVVAIRAILDKAGEAAGMHPSCSTASFFERVCTHVSHTPASAALQSASAAASALNKVLDFASALSLSH
jgi:hypothetical protein